MKLRIHPAPRTDTSLRPEDPDGHGEDDDERLPDIDVHPLEEIGPVGPEDHQGDYPDQIDGEDGGDPHDDSPRLLPPAAWEGQDCRDIDVSGYHAITRFHD